MPNVAMPSFFIDRMSRTSSYGLGRSSGRDPESLSDTTPEESLPRMSLSVGSTASLTPFQPSAPTLLPSEGRLPSASMTGVVDGPLVPVSLAAQSIIKSGPLRKHSRNVTGAWQSRFLVLEGHPTHVMVYYYASAAAEASASKPRGVVPLAEVSVTRFGRDNLSFRVKAPQRLYDFRAPSPEEAEDWIQCIGEAAEAARRAKAAGGGGGQLALSGGGAKSGKAGTPTSSSGTGLSDDDDSRRSDNNDGLGSLPEKSGGLGGGGGNGGGAGNGAGGGGGGGGSSSSSAGGVRQVTIQPHAVGAASVSGAAAASSRTPRGILSRALPSRQRDKASKPALPAMLSRADTWVDISSAPPLPKTSPQVSVSEDGSGVGTPQSRQMHHSGDL